MNRNCFIDVDFCQRQKAGQNVAGDVFLSRKDDTGRRVVSVLSDGLGSGVEANVLASLTATMALEYVNGNIETRRAAEIIMDALPVCHIRKISYSTFSIVDINIQGDTRIIEHGNPPFLFVRDGKCIDVDIQAVRTSRWNGREMTYAQFQMREGDRIVFFSDGITQSGIGSDDKPLGWGLDGVKSFVLHQVKKNATISSRDLSERLVNAAIINDGRLAGDDITCGVIYLRNPRYIRILTGPPYAKDRDYEFAQMVCNYPGHTVICGGTTSNIVARELEREITMDLLEIDPEIPTTSQMQGVDLITEGCITLSKVAEILESGKIPNRSNGATKLVDLLLQSDIIEFVVGTRINEAHQNPSLPIELDIRRNVIKKIIRLLQEKYLKATSVEFI